MVWKYKNDLNIEQPFFEDIKIRMNAKKINWQCGDNDAWEVTCPTCFCKRAVLTTSSKNTETAFVLLCPNKPACSKRKVYLKELIDLFCTDEQKDKYMRSTTYNTSHERYGWLPIKNRKTKKVKS